MGTVGFLSSFIAKCSYYLCENMILKILIHPIMIKLMNFVFQSFISPLLYHIIIYNVLKILPKYKNIFQYLPFTLKC